MPRKRPRILLIAEACNPEWTSVPLLAYYWYRALRKRANVTLVTQIRDRAALLRHVEPSARDEWRIRQSADAPRFWGTNPNRRLTAALVSRPTTARSAVLGTGTGLFSGGTRPDRRSLALEGRPDGTRATKGRWAGPN